MGIIITLAVILIVVVILKLILDELELSQPIRKIVMLIFALLVLLYLLQMFGVYSVPFGVHRL